MKDARTVAVLVAGIGGIGGIGDAPLFALFAIGGVPTGWMDVFLELLLGLGVVVAVRVRFGKPLGGVKHAAFFRLFLARVFVVRNAWSGGGEHNKGSDGGGDVEEGETNKANQYLHPTPNWVSACASAGDTTELRRQGRS